MTSYYQQQQQAEQTFWILFFCGIFAMAVFCAIIGSIIGDSKGKRKEGALLGLFLGIIGVIAIAVMKDDRPGAVSAPQRSQVPVSPAGWRQDPYGAHELRWWDGQAWREQVSDGGIQSVDFPPPPPPQTPGVPPPPIQPN